MDADHLPYIEFAVLVAGGLIRCIVPSFPVYSAVLREVKLQWIDEDGEIHVFDEFARYCQLLDHKLAAVAKVPVCHNNLLNPLYWSVVKHVMRRSYRRDLLPGSSGVES